LGLRWTRKAIVAEIKRLHAEGAELNYATAEDNHLNLVRAAAWHFGTWRRAVESAGIEYDSISKYQRWNRERIVARIRELHSEGADLNWRAVSTEIDPPLAAAALRSNGFQSWRDAIRASGLDINGVARYQAWDEERVIKDIKALHRAGLPLSSKAVQLGNQPLFCAARRRFGSWDEALVAAGLSVQDIRLRQASGLPYGAVQQSNGSRNGTGRERTPRNEPTNEPTPVKKMEAAGAAKISAVRGATKGSTARIAATVGTSKGGNSKNSTAQKPKLLPSKRPVAAVKGVGKTTPTPALSTAGAAKDPATSRTVTSANRPTSGGKNATRATSSTQTVRNMKNQGAAKGGASKGSISKGGAVKGAATKGAAVKGTVAKRGASKVTASNAGAAKKVASKAGAPKSTKSTAAKGTKTATKRR
jgi:hypothetical protein